MNENDAMEKLKLEHRYYKFILALFTMDLHLIKKLTKNIVSVMNNQIAEVLGEIRELEN